MAYVKKAETSRELKDKFLKKCSDRWGEYEFFGDYVNSNTKAVFRHKSCGNEFKMTPHNFGAGHGCPKCALRRKAESLKESKGSRILDLIKESNGEYELRSEYVNNRTPVAIYHKKCGRVSSRRPSTVCLKSFSGELCTLCARDADTARKTYSLKEANARLTEVNSEYEFVTYFGASSRALVRHSVCGEMFYAKASYFILGDGHCPKCTTNISKGERELYNWVKSICPEAEQSARDIENVSEIDILVRDKGVGIEFNGHFWHSAQRLSAPSPRTGKPRMSYAEAKRYHYEKSFWAEKAGIRLIHVWDYEWEDERKRRVLENIILGALGMLPERYFARKTTCHHYKNGCDRWKELDKFFAENNIQGNRGGSDVFTLEDDSGRVLMAYKFGRPSGGRAKNLYEYEMVRGASAYGVQVVGGASKLWKHAMAALKPNSVVYYIDYNYFDGRSVNKLGGKFIGSQPGVKNYWVKNGVVKNREPRRHNEIKQAIKNGDVLELWNAGTKTYAFLSSEQALHPVIS